MVGRELLRVVVAGVGIGSGAGWAQFWEVDNRFLTPFDEQAAAEAGRAVAIGDFDGDGINDFVYGVPGWDSATASDAGRWFFIRGSTTRSHAAMGSISSADEGRSGFALAAGDFNGDGRDEVAVARPYAAVVDGGDTYPHAGTVWIQRYADEQGWILVQTLSQLDTVFTGPEPEDQFGSALTSADFNADGRADLAVSAPFEDWGAEADVGIVHVFYGSAAGGLRTDNDQAFVAGVDGMLGSRNPGERLGHALASADFDDDGDGDLAIGAPFRHAGAFHAGQVHVLDGTAAGLALAGQQLLGEGHFGGTAEGNDNFGYALAAANFDEGGFNCAIFACYDDLAIGIPGQAVLQNSHAGRVLVAYGGASGILTTGSDTLDQDLQSGTPEEGDRFGLALAAGQANRHRNALNAQYADLVVGSPGEDVVTIDDGALQLFFGSSAGIDAGQQEQALYQRPGFESAPAAANDNFGEVLALGDLDGDGWGDLLAGIPAKNMKWDDVGGVQVLYGALFADGFESGGVLW